MTQAELAAELDVTANTVARWERAELQIGHPRRVLRRLEQLERGSARNRVHAAAPQTAGHARQSRLNVDETAIGGHATRVLPSELSSFVGRQLELRHLRNLPPSTRLLTLIGAGGIGKTRLALELLDELQSEAQLVVSFADLSSLAHPNLVPQGVALALGVREQPGRSLVATLVEALEGSAVVLVLDNCEQVVQACAVLAHELLRACPNLRIVATSRERLGITGETVWPVPPLSIPEPTLSADRVQHTEAVELFAQRARAAYPAFELDEKNLSAISEICRRLDGIPLALELAAARASLLSLEHIASRLEDSLGLLTRGSRLAADRQQTVRGTLDWSYRLLTAPEQLLLDRLAVFAGGWTLEAAEAVACDDALNGPVVITVLGHLADKSLVVVEPQAGGQMRYRLLETVRQYALERLTARAEKWHQQQRHANYFLVLVERLQRELKGHLHGAAQMRLEREHDNCRAALRWFIEADETDAALRLAGGLGRFWFFRGYLEEGEAWFARVLTLPRADRPTAGRAMCLFGSGRLALSAEFRKSWALSARSSGQHEATGMGPGTNGILY